jgi:hypothetical protein
VYVCRTPKVDIDRSACMTVRPRSNLIGLPKDVIGQPHEHSLRRQINRPSRPCVEIVRHLPKFVVYGGMLHECALGVAISD